MRIGSLEFSPGLWPSIATLILLPILCGLGLWQVDRGAAKRELLDAYARHSQAAPVTVDARAAFDSAWRYHHVRITGRYDLAHQFLLDNQMQDGLPGYHVFTPLLVDNTQQAILVNRGWLPLGDSRRRLPALPGPAGAVTVTGVLAPVPGHGVELGADIESDSRWPRVVEAIDLPRLQRDITPRLAPQIVRLDPAAPAGFVRKWRIVEDGPERNYGYAFQWFTLAAVLLFIYIRLNTRRVSRERGRAGND